MRPARWARWPASTARRRAVAMATGSAAPKMALAARTASQPSSRAWAASEAVPMPASRMTGTPARSVMIAMLYGLRMAAAEPIGAPDGITGAPADRRAERHHRGAACLLEAAGEDRIVVGVWEDGEAVGDELLGGVEELDRVGEESAVVADHLELYPLGLEGLAGQ